VAFRWPNDRAEIIKHLETHLGNRSRRLLVPESFEFPNRRSDLAMDEHALWADLDEVDPREIRDYPPTIAWQTSPGRYQALWLADEGDFQGASWPGNENQRLTYLLGADPSGWDTTQLLRLPEWPNHKPEYLRLTEGPLLKVNSYGLRASSTPQAISLTCPRCGVRLRLSSPRQSKMKSPASIDLRSYHV
jgi:hypothetical protein